MASNVTLLELRTQAKDRADMKNSAFLSDTEWNTNINSAAAELYDILVSVAEDYYTTSATITTSGATATLPSDFYKLVGIDYSLGGQNVPMSPFVFRDRLLYANQNGNTLRYRLVGSSLTFIPTPPTQSMTLWYVPAFQKLTLDASTFNGVNGWEDYIVADAAMKALMKEESDVSAIMAEKAGIEKRIRNMAPNRDQGRAEAVTDVSNYGLFERYNLNDIF